MNPLSVAGDLRRLPRAHLLRRPDAFDAVLRDLTHRFADGAERHDRDASFPFGNFAELQRHGLVAAVVPVAAGGGGASLAHARRIVSSVARGEPSTALVLTMTYLVHRSISRPDSCWSPRLRDALYRSAVEDGALANSLRVEPALGSPARGGLPETVARRVGDGWRLSGHKLYATGIPALRWLAVWARTDEPQPRLGVFLVPREAAGIRVIESWDHLGLRASGSHEAVFDAVALPLDHAVDIRPAADWEGGPDADQHAWMIVLLGALYDGGNHGLSRRNPLERHHRDVLCSRIHTPQNDSVLVAAGRLAFERAA